MSVVKDAVKSIWRDDQGPGENIGRLISYIPSAFGWGGMALTAIDKILSEYGYGLEDYGRYLDESGLIDVMLGAQVFAEVDYEMHKVSSISDGLVKKAFLWSKITKYMARRGLLKALWAAFKKAAKYIIMAFGLTHLGELTEKLKPGASDEPLAIEEVSKMFKRPKYPSLDPKYYGPKGYMGPRS